MAAHQAPPSLGFSRQEHWSGLPFPSPMHESEKWKWSRLVVSDSSGPHRLQPTRLLCPWNFPGKSTGVGCHCLLRDWTLELHKGASLDNALIRPLASQLWSWYFHCLKPQNLRYFATAATGEKYGHENGGPHEPGYVSSWIFFLLEYNCFIMLY